MKLKSIDFWIKIESLYKNLLDNQTDKEPTFMLIECLVGFSSSHRGSTEFLLKLQNAIKSRNLEKLKDLDLVRLMYGMSMLP